MSLDPSVAAFAAWLAEREAKQAAQVQKPQGLRLLSSRAERTRDVLQTEHAECREILEAFKRLVTQIGS